MGELPIFLYKNIIIFLKAIAFYLSQNYLEDVV